MSFGRSGSFPDYGATSVQSSRPTVRSSSDTLYHQLCDNISCNIFSINNSVTGLENAAKEIGTQSDTALFRDRIHTTQLNIKELVGSTTRFLKELTSLVQRGEREQRLQSERLRNEFQATVQRYDILQKQMGPKMKHVMTVMPPKTRVDNEGLTGWKVDDEEDESQSLMDAEKLQQQQQMQEEFEFEQGLLLEREQRIREIESDMLDVNQIFRDLAAMVHEQGEVIGTIEENVSVAANNVEEGQQQLSKASEYQNKYRKKMCWFILILIVVAIILTIVIVLSVKK